METKNPAFGNTDPQAPDAERFAPLPPPARMLRLESGRAFVVPSQSLGRLRGIFSEAIAPGEPTPDKEKVMEALLIHEYASPSASPKPVTTGKTPEARTARTAAIFAAIYLALVLCAPFIVRYGPSTDDRAMAALATQLVKPRCVSNPDSGVVCQGHSFTVGGVRAASDPDL
jgi:hypothetical protein